MIFCQTQIIFFKDFFFTEKKSLLQMALYWPRGRHTFSYLSDWTLWRCFACDTLNLPYDSAEGGAVPREMVSFSMDLPVQVVATLLLMQLSAHFPGKVAKDAQMLRPVPLEGKTWTGHLFPSSAWPSPGPCGHLECEPYQVEDLPPSLSLAYSFK